MNDWLIWQLIDSAFPGGALAHSGGLEAAVQAGLVHDANSIEQFVQVSLAQQARGPLILAIKSWREPDSIVQIDAECDLLLNDHVANRASRAQGQALLSSAGKIFEAVVVSDLSTAVRRRQLCGHLAPAFGVVCKTLGVSEIQTRTMFLFLVARTLISSAVRLGIIGPLEGQRILSTLAVRSDVQSTATNLDEALPGPVRVAPIIDLLQGSQDRLYSRLFQS